MNLKCAIKLCNSKQNERNFFKIPKDDLQRLRWIEAIGHKLRDGIRATKNLRICELHFEQKFILGSTYRQRNREFVIRQRVKLCKNALPTIFPSDNQSDSIQDFNNDHIDDQNSLHDVEDMHVEDLNTLHDLDNMHTVEDQNTFHDLDNIHVVEDQNTFHDLDNIHVVEDQNTLHDMDNMHTVELKYEYETLKKDLSALGKTELPEYWQYVEGVLGPLLIYLGDSMRHVSRSIFIAENMNVEIRADGRVIQGHLFEKISSLNDVFNIMSVVQEWQICIGFGDVNLCDKGFFMSSNNRLRCTTCKNRWLIKRNKARTISRKISEVRTKQRSYKNVNRQNRRLQQKVQSGKHKIAELEEACAASSETSLLKAIEDFPLEQREAIKACFTAARCKTSQGRRYSNEWVLQCLFLRIKSRKAYLHILHHKILPVPTIVTLNKYIQSLKPSYGFNMEVFNVIKLKVANMKVEERRGCLVVDEMRVSEALSFDSSDLLFKGFTDLGEYTPNNQKKERGDEGLVFMFQPFRGSWVQTVGAFLSKGCASGAVLQRLISEAVILLENAGLFVDVVTSDGATWNRAMWKHFGLKKFENKCEHPCSTLDEESSRYLYFCSDFSHLGKNFRNFVTAAETTWTPEGTVKLAHFRAVLTCDAVGSEYSLKVAPKLTIDHVHPKPLQKMNVGMAYQLFSAPVSAALKLYRTQHPDLSDCEPTILLVERFHKLIEAMTSRSTFGALSLSSISYKTIVDFQKYIEDWYHQAAVQGHRFLSQNTYEGIIVTLKTTIDLFTFLKEKCGYSYLMTARLNQDALERFFGMLRSACGSSDHPDSLLFIQVYRLLSLYSLVKPPKGSNVEGHEIFESLLNVKDFSTTSNQQSWTSVMDTFVEGETTSCIVHDHTYNKIDTQSQIHTYMAGFVGRKIKAWTKCQECIATAIKGHEEATVRDDMINFISKGFLIYPSNAMFDLLNELELIIGNTLAEQGGIDCFSFLDIAQRMVNARLPFIGCAIHKHTLTKRIINYYMLSRARMISKAYNKERNEARKGEISLRKQSKLVKSKQKFPPRRL